MCYMIQLTWIDIIKLFNSFTIRNNNFALNFYPVISIMVLSFAADNVLPHSSTQKKTHKEADPLPITHPKSSKGMIK